MPGARNGERDRQNCAAMRVLNRFVGEPPLPSIDPGYDRDYHRRQQRMTGSRDELLQPSLADDARPAAAPYSVQTTFLTGFFGGPFAATAIFITNAVRMKRVARDAPVWIAMLIAIVAGWWFMQHTD